jgi:hypothetical protein
MHTHRYLRDTYRFSGFRPTSTVPDIFGGPKALVIHLYRLEKTGMQRVRAGRSILVRPQGTACARPALRRHAMLPGSEDSSCRVQDVRQSEAGILGLIPDSAVERV